MNGMTESALLQQVNTLKTAHNALVNKTGVDLDQHATAIRQLAVALTSLEQRIVALEGVVRGGRPPVMQQPQGVPRSAPQTAPVPQPATAPVPQPQTAPATHPMSSGWADDEEDAQLEE